MDSRIHQLIDGKFTMALTNSDAKVVFETASFDGPSNLDPILDGLMTLL